MTWVVTAVMTLLGALSYGELAAAMPEAGGQYVFLKRIYHRAVRFPVRVDGVYDHTNGYHCGRGGGLCQVYGRVPAAGIARCVGA